MKILLAFLLILLIGLNSTVFSQTLTQKQAFEIADQLYEKKILTKKGKKELMDRIQKQNLSAFNNYRMNGSIDMYDAITKAGILMYCGQAFQEEYDYRYGLSTIIGQSEKKQAKIQKRFEQLLAKFNYDTSAVEQYWLKKAPKSLTVEYAIPAEDSVIQQSRVNFGGAPKHPKHLIDNSRSVWGKTRSRTARNLFEIGLMDEKVYGDVVKALEDSSITIEEEVCMFASNRTMYYYTYQENKAEQLAYLDTLYQEGVFSKKGYDQLLASYQPYELKSRFDLLSYAQHALVFDLRKYSKDPLEFYSLLFKQIQQILPEFGYQNLEILTKQEDEGGELIRMDITLSFSVDGVLYQHTFLHDYIRKDGQDFDPVNWAIVSNDFHKGINKYLTDKQSPYRIYFANKADKSGVYGREYVGLILLTEKQRKAWGEAMYFLSHESHDTRFTSAGIQNLFSEYQSLGLFSHLSEQELEEGKKQLATQEINSYQDILLCFPSVIHFFDWETGNLENPYEEHTKAFSVISRGAFQPANVEDNFDQVLENGKKVKYSFELGGKKYDAELENRGDWLDPLFLHMIEKAMEENNVKGKLYDCLEDGQASGYIFLTDQQYKTLKVTQPDLLPE